jgi:hypothetical protein
VLDPADPLFQATRLFAGLDADAARALLAKAKAARMRERDAALRQVRAEFYADLGDWPAAVEIEAAARHNRAVPTASAAARPSIERRSAARSRLKELLGPLDDVPGAHRIRQVIVG